MFNNIACSNNKGMFQKKIGHHKKVVNPTINQLQERNDYVMYYPGSDKKLQMRLFRMLHLP